jgi:hypothetical protein
MNKPTMRTTSLARGLGGALLGLLAACGGGGDGRSEEFMRAAAAAPLLDDEGRPMASVVEPEDPQARTLSRLYATPEQAGTLQRTMGSRLLDIDLDCCGDHGAEVAVLIAYGVQAAGDLDDHTPVLVRSRDARQAAATADRLAQMGFDRVFVVTR